MREDHRMGEFNGQVIAVVGATGGLGRAITEVLRERSATVAGKRLIENFSDDPFGWSPDTLRYLVAALLVAGEIKLKISGREITCKQG